MKFQKDFFFWGGGGRVGGQGGRVWGGGQGRCERRSEVFVKIKKKWGGGPLRGSGLGRVRVDVNEELSFCKKK